MEYDLVVVGSGPAGQRAAIQAAKLSKKVLLVEKDSLGGASLHLGTIPSKTLRSLSMECVSTLQSSLLPSLERMRALVKDEMQIVLHQINRNKVEFMQGKASFIDPHQLEIKSPDGSIKLVKSKFIVLATGTRPRLPEIPKGINLKVYSSDSILNMEFIPKRLAILGAGVIGCEYVSIFANYGSDVVLIDKRKDLLRGVDTEIVDRLFQYMKRQRVEFRLGPENVPDDFWLQAEAKFDAVLYCMGRIGNVDLLNLESAGLASNNRGLMDVNKFFQTSQPHIYAVGDLVGMPALAATAYEQGRIASAHAFGLETEGFPTLYPYGIYTIPEISSVGLSESEIKEKNIEFVVGRAKFSELARGKIIGDSEGFLKLFFDKNSQKLLGAHVIGSNASELVHIAQVALSFDAHLKHMMKWIFNYPTLAEAYKVAALNAFNQMQPMSNQSEASVSIPLS